MQENLVGTVIDNRYRVIEQLGFGGMGTVYKASQVGAVSRLVALKLMDKNAISDSDSRERFLREAKSLSALCHPNIVSFFHIGLWNNSHPYMAMELIKGKDLAKELAQKGRRPWKEAVDMAIQCCAAMDYAHNNNIISRDLKPQNIMLTESEDGVRQIKIIDFGLCKVTGNSAETLTQTGSLIGSVFYMSPEQCQGEPCTKQSDIYSLGCVLYELLTGVVPLSADTAVGMLHKHIHESPARLREAAPGAVFPEGLENCVFKAMAKQPTERYQTMSDFAKDLRLISNGQGNQVSADTIKTTAPAWRNPSPKVRILIAAATVLLVAVTISNSYTQILGRCIFYRFFDSHNARTECLLDAERVAKTGIHSGALLLCRTALSIPEGSNSSETEADSYCRAANIALVCGDQEQAEHWIALSLKALVQCVKDKNTATQSKTLGSLVKNVCTTISECGHRTTVRLADDLLALGPLLRPEDKIPVLQLLLERYKLGARLDHRELGLIQDLATTYIATGQPKLAYQALLRFLKQQKYNTAESTAVRELLVRSSAQVDFSERQYKEAVPEFERALESVVSGRSKFAPEEHLLENYRYSAREAHLPERGAKFLDQVIESVDRKKVPHDYFYLQLVDSRFCLLVEAGKSDEADTFIKQRLALEEQNPKASPLVLSGIYWDASESALRQKDAHKTMKWSEKVVEIASRNNIPFYWALGASRIACMMSGTNLDQAADYAENFIRQWSREERETTPGYFATLNVIIKNELRKHEYEKAQQLINSVLTKSKERQDLPGILWCKAKQLQMHQKQGLKHAVDADQKQIDQLLIDYARLRNMEFCMELRVARADLGYVFD